MKEDRIITLTQRAGALLHQIQEDQGLTEPPRIVPPAGPLTLTVSQPEPDDEILYLDATPVLRVAPEAAVALAGCTITTEETPDRTHLAIVADSAPDGRVTEGGP